MEPATPPPEHHAHDRRHARAGAAARPAQICSALLAALDAADGRRRMRKRDQTPDAIGLAVKRQLLERAIDDDPDPDDLEGWLLCYAHRHEGGTFGGAVSAMARVVLDEWRLAHTMQDFAAWLELGAPSDDALPATAASGQRVPRPGAGV